MERAPLRSEFLRWVPDRIPPRCKRPGKGVEALAPLPPFLEAWNGAKRSGRLSGTQHKNVAKHNLLSAPPLAKDTSSAAVHDATSGGLALAHTGMLSIRRVAPSRAAARSLTGPSAGEAIGSRVSACRASR